MKKIFFLFTVFLLLTALVNVQANTEIAGLKQGDWERLLEEPVYLEIKEKKQLHPFYLGDFLDEEYSFQASFSDEKTNEIINPQLCLEKNSNPALNFCLVSQSFSRSAQKEKNRKFFVQEDEVKIFLEKLAEKIDTPPIEGKYRINEDGSFVAIEESKTGLSLDVEKNYSLLLEKIVSGKISSDENILLATTKTAPSVTPESLKNLGIKEKVARGESNFVGSPKNRVHNIHTAVKKFDGLILKPQEELSFVTLLGPVDETTGYKEELVIKDNKTIPEFGGGICQVSTTLFRAALNGGLKITERKNHAYPVNYYSPQGTDATIYIPKPDLRFVNDTPSHLLIQASFDGTKLIFDFFGTSDGRQVELEGPTVVERTPDGKMRVVLYQVVKNEKGEEIRKDTFRSFYDNPDKYHEPEFVTKPKDWSNKQWEEYLKKRS